MTTARAARARGTIVTAVLLATAAAFPACTHHHKAAPPPVPESTTTTGPDLALVSLRGVNGTTTTTLPATPGKASITGRVVEASGAGVPGATVRAEWFVNAAPVVTDVQAGEDGVYQLPTIHGGVWRLRAFRAPDRATDDNPTFFLNADEQKKLDIKVATVSGAAVTNNIAPNPPVVGQDAELAVLLTEQSVDSDGRVVRTPISGADVTLTGSGHWSLPAGSSTRVTDAKGVATWRVVCRAEGHQPLSVSAMGQIFDLTLPDCAAETTTTTGTSDSTTTTRPATTTTRFLSSTTTTR